MSIEYLLVNYPDERDVLADGDPVGTTNHTIVIQGDEYIITLSGDGYVPQSQPVVIAGTSIQQPKIVVFTAPGRRRAG